MSNDGFKVQASIKDHDGDMVNFRADSPEELSHYLIDFPYADYAAAKAALRGAGAASAIAAPAEPSWAAGQAQQSPPQQQGGWGNRPQQTQQQAAPQGGSHPNAVLHPEGKACDMCGKPLEQKKTQNGKAKWQCPEWRWNNGNPNGHGMEWAN